MLSPRDARIHALRLSPPLPESLAPLREIADNLWWTWDPPAQALFAALSPELWERTGHNPIALLRQLDGAAIERVERDAPFHEHMADVLARFRAGVAPISPSPDRPWTTDPAFLVAYFCAEFALAECFQIYSGGLGVLAGDHLKSASELGVPLVGVGLLYRHGYFHQRLTADGVQREVDPPLEIADLPLHQVAGADGRALRVEVPLPGRTAWAAVWRCMVGRVPLYLLDTDTPENSEADRAITRNLYLGDAETRLKQEIVLGFGGVRALEAAGVRPSVFHQNEGHSALLSLERIRRVREATGATFDEARQAVAVSQVFTTHTPLPAGIDRFSPDLVERYLGWAAEGLGLDIEGLRALGRERVEDQDEWFSMAVLAIRSSHRCNAVSRLHGRVSRGMWRRIWPGVPEQDVPIGHVTNGVDLRAWMHPEVSAVMDRRAGAAWRRNAADPAAWGSLGPDADAELWAIRQRRRAELVEWCRGRIRAQLEARGAGRGEIEAAAEALSPDALTIGFARRFAAYKRGSLLMHDRLRLKRLLEDSGRPVQVLIAGKAHPGDGAGKHIIREVVAYAREAAGSRRVVFLDDYDLDVARRLVQGCDIWLNTPRRGLEASGTSGMKAALNGVLHVSILDGWWDEAYDPEVGFAIGRGETYADHEHEAQDAVESRLLYDLLERQIVPEFFERDAAGLPRRWLARVRACITRLGAQFNTDRMVAQYARDWYLPAHRDAFRFAADNLALARDVTRRIAAFRAQWPAVRVERVAVTRASEPSTDLDIRAAVHAGTLDPRDLLVQACVGPLGPGGTLASHRAFDLSWQQREASGAHVFTGRVRLERAGQVGVAVRVLPRVDNLPTRFIPGLIAWEPPELA